MKFVTTEKWDEALWEEARDIYLDAFGNKGGKPETIIRNMFAKGICFLHVLLEGNSTIGMAITGKVQGKRLLLIDYLAVKNELKGKGFGLLFFEQLKEWSVTEMYDGILLEAESEPTPDNLARIRFWKKCGFELLDNYTHHYIWVPEPYQAMWLPLKSNAVSINEGKKAFHYITAFHRESFRRES